jgi:hypothetical protein
MSFIDFDSQNIVGEPIFDVQIHIKVDHSVLIIFYDHGFDHTDEQPTLIWLIKSQSLIKFFKVVPLGVDL